MQTEPWTSNYKSMVIWSRHKLKYFVKWLKKFRSKSLGRTLGILLIPFNQIRTYRRILPRRLSEHEILILRSRSPL